MNLPMEQGVHAVEAILEYDPEEHGWQDGVSVPPDALTRYLPPGQAVHAGAAAAE